MQAESEKHSITGYLMQFHENLAEIRDNNRLVDFDIIVQGTKFPAHKLVLAASSDYFKAMFATNSKETTSNKVEFHDITAPTMQSILDFCYTCEIELNGDNVEEILLAASMLLIEAIKDICVDYIKERIDASNCLGVADLAERCGISSLFEVSYGYAVEKFESVINEKEFLDLDEDILKKFVTNDELNVSEANLLDSLIKWTNENRLERQSVFAKLLEHVRFMHIEPKRLVSFGTMDLVRETRRCLELIDSAKNYLILKSDPDSSSELEFNLKARNNLKNRQRIYSIGGWTDLFKAIATAEMYDPNANKWTEIASMTERRCGLGCAVLGDSIYAVGGHDGQSYLKSVERYDTTKNEWSVDVAAMNVARTSLGVAVLSDCLYAIGGQTNTGASDCVEKYDPKQNKWNRCAPLNQKKLGAGVAVLDNYIYVIGGAEVSSSSIVFATVERYDPRCDKWTLVAPMSTARKHLGCTSFNGKIYAIAGRCGGELNTGEVYDPLTDSWSELPLMHIKRHGLGVVELGGRIFAIGGQSDETHLNVVEAYDIDSMEWTWRAPMISDRLGAGMVVHPMTKY